MLGASGALTLVTVAGLVAGLGREWLLVAQWGAGARTDAFLIALFLPEAVRMMIGGGLLSSAAMAQWQGLSLDERPRRLAQLTFGLLLIGVMAAVAAFAFRTPLMHVIGPGLDAAHLLTSADAFGILAWTLPLFILQGWWSVPMHAEGRYIAAGLASLAYNLPAVACLAWLGPEATEVAVSWSFVGGSALAALFAARHPHHCARLLLSGITALARPGARRLLQEGLDLLSGDQAGAFAQGALTGLLNPLHAQDTGVSPVFRKALLRQMQRLTPTEIERYQQNTRRLLSFSGFEAYPTCPTLLLAGEHDHFTQPWEHARFAAACRDADCVLIHQADHLAQFERREACARLYNPFLRGEALPTVTGCTPRAAASACTRTTTSEAERFTVSSNFPP